MSGKRRAGVRARALGTTTSIVAAVAAVAVIVAVVGAIVDVRTAAAGFVAAYVAVTSVVLGTLAMIMIAHITTATWFGALRRRAELVVGAMPALALLGVVLVAAVILLDRPTDAGANPSRQLYLAPWFVAARTVVYWITWLLIAWSLRRADRLEAQGDVVAAVRRFRRTSCAGLVVLGLTMTFASFDWMMSLSGDWPSTIYGVYWFGGGMIAALSLLALLATRRDDDRAFPLVGEEQRKALGKLMLTFVMFWVYIGFAQYIVIWSADLPSEVTWYVARTKGPWGFVALLILLAGGAVPFLALLQSSVRRSGAWLAGLGALLLFIHYIDSYWLVLPAVVPFHWWTLIVSAACLVIVAAPAIVFAWSRRSTPEFAPINR
ncbi:MAG TPA: hypothetical protein VHV78_05105 [Gemmatimonadaceae bacterium]|nr:hypothetical protein [Gemmatimonadaceae bacterium]